jgi:23S rRNA (pseudouridine1915-N3)-methyltransferase
MDLKFVWPGRTRTPELRALQGDYLERIRTMAASRVIESREARGINERAAEKIKEIEAQGLEKHLDNDYIICLVDEGKQMSSEEFARFLERCQLGPSRSLAFVVGGFLGLATRILDLADLRLSLSRMTFSHELARVVLLEQVYRSLTIVKGKHYAK